VKHENEKQQEKKTGSVSKKIVIPKMPYKNLRKSILPDSLLVK